MAIKIYSYQYRGYELVVFPSGKIMIHRCSHLNWPVVAEVDSLDEAMRWVDKEAV